MDKSYRIHTNISSDTVLDVNMKQDFDFLEVLSLKLGQNDAYRIHSSNYGVIVGRVLANDAFGIPNAKVSVFIERNGNDTVELENIYPYAEITSKDREGRRYNLLPDYSDDECYRVVGTFPNKRLMLDDDIQVEIYDKYWKYTTVTNNAGDYMIFGVPTGNTEVHVDIDLSDIGVLSQRPRDFQYKGYSQTLFDSPSQFKESTNLDNLTQIFSQNSSVYVYPFWGDAENGIAAITRRDIQIQYKFEPTCVFMGSIVSDNDANSIGHRCAPEVNNGMNNQLIGGSGTIEMIRKTIDGLVEEYQIQGNQLIDDDGVWCYQIPMNLDYVGTDEYGNIVPTDNPNKGVPTRTQVRFRISKNETGDEGFSRHTAKYLVPMNPIFSEDELVPTIDVNGSEIEKMYNFGSATPESCFRDLYWNNVYSVKNYIPKTQVARRAVSKNYSALKGANLADNQNPVPFNKLRIDLPFTYILICILVKIIMLIVGFINSLMCIVYEIIHAINKIIKIIKKIPGVRRVIPTLDWLERLLECIPLSAGLDEGREAFFIGCWCHNWGSCPDEMDGDCVPTDDGPKFMDRVQRNLAKEYKIVKLDLYQDWINGTLFMPLWYWRKRTKKKFLFFTISKAKNEYCSSDNIYKKLKTRVGCVLQYANVNLLVTRENIPDSKKSDKKWHKNRDGQVRYRNGLIKQVENKDGLEVYYYSAIQATSDNQNPDEEMIRRKANFYAIRLYATDIILLGSLDPNNLYGIPQFFTCLPATTANVPPIATIEESNEDNDEKVENDEYDTSEEDSGTTLTTGMDWNNDGDKQRPNYKTGLFMDLACTYVLTLPKSCINVERLSELGVALDMKKSVAYRSNGGIKYGDMDSDGFITKIELDDNENRAMFATMNHIGFIPQVYQEMNGFYQTQVLDKNTNYLIPKFKYLYPVDFDGRMRAIIDKYRNGFPQALDDIANGDYLTFRLGAESSKNKSNNSEERIRHFYLEKNGLYSMPLYNNSFYFYFGINKGKTAIDKFNQMFYAACTSNNKAPFTLDVTARGKSYCPDAYNGDCGSDCGVSGVYESGTNKNNAYGYIRVKSDDIRKPYTYELYDAFGGLVISESGMDVDEFVIGGIVCNGEVLSNCNGYVKEQLNNNGVLLPPLENQTYTLVVIDSDGKSITQKVKLEVPKVNGKYTVVHLGTKFYDGENTRIDYICHDDNKFYGEINMSGFTIDSYECTLKFIQYIGYSDIDDCYKFCITGRSDDISEEVVVYFEIRSLNDSEEGKMRNCLCEDDGSINLIRASQERKAEVKMYIEDTLKPIIIGPNEPFIYSFIDGVFSLKVFQPNQYLITLTQGCNSCSELVVANSDTSIVEVLNGTPFTTYLNGMPTLFMLGTKNDNKDADIANKSFFYYKNWSNIPSTTDVHLKGWYGVHQEDTYLFPKTIDGYKTLWEDSLDKGLYDMKSASVKRQILLYKFNKMFAVSDGVYVTTASPLYLEYTSTGGVQPILHRQVVPNYQKLKGYVFQDENKVVIEPHQSNIVGYNYDEISGNGPQFNKFIDDGNRTLHLNGNYFAAFTRDGSYINAREIDGININIERSPSFASISPDIRSNQPKQKGKINSSTTIEDFKLAYDKGEQTLVGDKLRNTLPYFRGMFVDRRFDYDLAILAPVMGSYFTLNKDALWKEDVWKGARLSGTTYNGIEMAYDGEYNIISAVTENEGQDNETASRLKRLEYSYSLTGNTSSNALTYYNPREDECVWNDGNLFYDEVIDSPNKPLIKQFYSSDVNGVDIRQFYWSNFNKWRLFKFADSKRIYGLDKFYVFKYPDGLPKFYNGEFDRESVANIRNSNYPTRRYIDIGKLPSIPYFYFENVGCSYGIKATMTQDYKLECKAKEGEVTNIEIDFSKPITMVQMNEDNLSYENVLYKTNTREQEKITFKAENVKFRFKFNEFSCDGHDSYTKTPKVIRVLPRFGTTDKIDGIGYIKLSNEGNEFQGQYSDGKTLRQAIDTVKILEFPTDSLSIWNFFRWTDSGYMFPDGVSVSDGFFIKDGERLLSNDTDFMNIECVAVIDKSKLGDTKVLSVLVEREIKGNDDDKLTRRIQSTEFSEIFDCRDLCIGLINGKEYGCYVVLNKTSDSSSNTDDEGNTNTETTNTKLFNQILTLTLIFKNDTSLNPEDLNCEILMDSSLMSYKFFFRNNNDEQFEVIPSDIRLPDDVGNEDIVMEFTLRWGADMGILSDDVWKGGNCKCSFMASSVSNFIYKTEEFAIYVDNDAPKREDITDPDTHYQTIISFT